MFNRRELAIVVIASAAAACTGGQIDPNKVVDSLKSACGIAVPAATVVAIINASVGATVQSIVDLLCSGFHQALAERKLGATAGTKVEYDVVVNGQKIHVEATKQ